MSQEPKQEKKPARAEKPAPAGKAEQPKSRAANAAPVTELTEADLQAISGGAGKGGIGGEFKGAAVHATDCL